MFAPQTTSKLAQRTLGALRLTRSFLLLEDDYDVDWEVDYDEPLTQQHPHRVPLCGPGRRSRRVRARRAGETAAGHAICLSPLDGPAPSLLNETRGAARERRDSRHERSEARA
jgi:hypothetical protein